MEKSITLSKTFQWFFLLFVLLCAFLASAQITITQADMPFPGLVIMRDMDTATITEPGGAGLNQTWDYSDAVSHLGDTVTFALPSEVPGGDLFPEANLAEGRSIFDPAGNFYNYIFWNSAEDGMYGIGWVLFFEVSGSTYNSIQNFDPVPNTLPLPFTYGSSSSTSTTGERYTSTRFGELLIDSSHVISHITVNINVDGSGNLITPVDTYPALRIEEQSTHVDSTWSWTQAGGWEFERVETFELTNYRWFANNWGEVATLSIDEDLIQFQWLSSVLIDVPSINYNAGIKIYPNPAGDLLFIQTDKKIDYSEIYSVNGKLLLTVDDLVSIDISGFDPGMYICRTYASGTVSTGKFVKR